MPHDKNGNPLKAGDRVRVLMEVEEIYQTDELCNARLVTVEPMWPGTSKASMTVNGRQVEKVTD